ncbi:MAG TPA: TonB-dependent receptor [Chitinophagaceae bacterium]|nr:TonB-dependent receptor [Chitinophagaceae bacterium]
MVRTLIHLTLLLLSFTSYAQKNISFSGRVVELSTGNGLAGASVLIQDARLGTVTDSTGNFFFRNIPRGHHLVEVSFLGYSSVLQHLDIEGDKQVTIELNTAVIENQGVTVTGIAAASSRKAPIPVTILRRTDLLETPSTNIIDALSKQTGVSQVSTGPAISKPVIRGLGFNRVVVINDGVRQEGQQWGEEHGIEVDDASITRAEILKGPASLIYGSDALAGVVNLITNVPVSEGTIKGNFLSNFQSNNKLFSNHASIGGNQQGFNWNAYGSLKSAGDYKNRFDGRVLNSRFNEKNFGSVIGLNKRWGYARLVYNSFNQNLGIIEGDREQATGRFLVYPGTPLERSASETDLSGRSVLTPFQKVAHNKILSDNNFTIGKNRLKIMVGYQNNKRKEFASNEEANEDNPELFFNLNTYTYNGSWTLPELKRWRTTLGFNGMTQLNENKGEEKIIPDYVFNDAGGFVYTQGLYDKYTISGGVRFDNRYIHAKEDTENGVTKFLDFKKNFSNFSGSAGISYEPNDYLTFKANAGTGFRAPNLAELSSNGAHEGTNRWEYGQSNLKSEKSFQLDGEMDVNNEHLTLGVNIFYNKINNFIFYRKLQSTTGSDSLIVDDAGDILTGFKFDQNNAKLYGFEVNLDLHPHPLDWLHFENKISFVRGVFTNNLFGTDNLPLIPAPRWISELRANIKQPLKYFGSTYFLLELDYNFEQDRPFTAYDTETPTGAYALLNAGFGTEISRRKKTLFNLYFAANNLTDEAYQNHLSRLKYTALNERTGRRGVYNTGRNFSVKLNIPFSFTTK